MCLPLRNIKTPIAKFIATQELIIPDSCVVQRDLGKKGFAVRCMERTKCKKLKSFSISRSIMLHRYYVCALLYIWLHNMYCCYQSCYKNLNVQIADVPLTALAKWHKLRTANLKVIGRLIDNCYKLWIMNDVQTNGRSLTRTWRTWGKAAQLSVIIANFRYGNRTEEPQCDI
jgi:hypothetical protein